MQIMKKSDSKNIFQQSFQARASKPDWLKRLRFSNVGTFVQQIDPKIFFQPTILKRRNLEIWEHSIFLIIEQKYF